MKLATFTHGGRTRLGVVVADRVADIETVDSRVPRDLRRVLEGGEEALAFLAAAALRAHHIDLSDVRLEAPISRPRKVLGLGLSYGSHLAELRRRDPAATITGHQIWFNKQVTAITGPFDPVHLPRVSSALDYEGELVVVVGRHARHVAAVDAHRVIAGYMVGNDVSVRDWQKRTPTATLGKSFDTHAPTGPWLTTADEVEDPHALAIRTWVDGDLRQDGTTRDLIYSIGAMIAELSTVFTLEPGDILMTGSPAGVGQSFVPPRFLVAGQTVRVEIDGLGEIRNTVIDEPDTARG